ncbi:RHS repeat-associated core domain-containing protein [Pseudomonas asplenii]|uniref:RHS repeat-associated core domain-containing protein n=1 Tax=Pseudomonas asplenii TaxID=53407 RepID=UPI0006CE2322|nr:RHS repeat-associated core domain-containing protein [Pseudomonas fuscovaginae]KPA97199.1 RHS repeat-associated core domain [Pseudomonas fuscovaginae]
MPTSARETLLCRYHYDPLDRLADCSPVDQASVQRFYCKSRLASEIQGTVRTGVFQYDDHLLAQHRQDANASESHLLATDTQGSVLHCLSPQQRQPSAYSAYGQRTPQNGLLSLLGFNGERPDPLTGHYLLGNGYRAFNPVLMRFNSPDNLSPFGQGGLNAYAYCLGDPVNRQDPTGHVPGFGEILSSLPRSRSHLTTRPGRAQVSQPVGTAEPSTPVPVNLDRPPGAPQTGLDTLTVPIDSERVATYSISAERWRSHPSAQPAPMLHSQPSQRTQASSSTRPNQSHSNYDYGRTQSNPQIAPPTYREATDTTPLRPTDPDYGQELFQRVSRRLENIRHGREHRRKYVVLAYL